MCLCAVPGCARDRLIGCGRTAPADSGDPPDVLPARKSWNGPTTSPRVWWTGSTGSCCGRSTCRSSAGPVLASRPEFGGRLQRVASNRIGNGWHTSSVCAIARRQFEGLTLVGDHVAAALVAQTDRYKVFAVSWPVVGPIRGEGLLLVPNGSRAPRADVIAVPDADQTPEMICGLEAGVAEESQFARTLADERLPRAGAGADRSQARGAQWPCEIDERASTCIAAPSSWAGT